MKWRDRVQEYIRERGEGSLRNLEQARRECQDRERWKLFYHGHPLVGAPRSRHRNELNLIEFIFLIYQVKMMQLIYKRKVRGVAM